MQFEGIVFPGQGTQYLGMGKDFYETYPKVKEIFDKVSTAIDCDIYSICQNNDTLLHNTEYTQPCILTLEIAMYEILKQYCGLSPKFFAGHSLGEYAALVANDIIPIEVAAKIVKYRGKLMQEEVASDQKGCMAAIIMDQIPFEAIEDRSAEFNVDVANDNSNQQIVISGYKDNLEATIANLELVFKEQPLRIVYLTVSAPFHSRYMQRIEPLFKEYLLNFKNQFDTKKLNYTMSNYTGCFYADQNITTLVDCLTKQISGSVKWRHNMQGLIEKTKDIIEVGPGTPLRGFFKTLGINISSIHNVKSIDKIFTVPA